MSVFREGIKVYGEYHLILRDKFGNILKEITVPNVITNAGLAELAGLTCADVGGTGWDYLALGTDATAAAVGQTALIAEIDTNGGERTAGTGTRQTTNVANDTFQLVVNWSFTGNLNIREIGLFNATPAGGTMLSRQTMSFNASNGDSLQATYRIIFVGV